MESYRQSLIELNQTRLIIKKTEGGDLTNAIGGLLLLATFVQFILLFYAMFVSKFMPFVFPENSTDLTGARLTGNKILDYVRQDHYYCYLIPLTVPVLLFAVIMNWMGMKFFRHN